MLRYQCLVLDHDDTTVDSTRTVNYPQFQEALAHFRPNISMTLDEYRLHCFDPGFYEMCKKVLHYSDQEMDAHVEMWEQYHQTHHPPFFTGIAELIQRQKNLGGYVCVVSHSSKDVILAAYRHAGLPIPDLIFGAEQPPERRKPNPWPLKEIMHQLSLPPEQVLMVDDMPLGGIMSQAVGVKFACAGWCSTLPQIEIYMKSHCDYYFPTVQSLYDHLFFP